MYQTNTEIAMAIRDACTDILKQCIEIQSMYPGILETNVLSEIGESVAQISSSTHYID